MIKQWNVSKKLEQRKALRKDKTKGNRAFFEITEKRRNGENE